MVQPREVAHAEADTSVASRIDTLGAEVEVLERELSQRLSRLAILKTKMQQKATDSEVKTNNKNEPTVQNESGTLAAAAADADAAEPPTPPTMPPTPTSTNGVSPTKRLYLHDTDLLHLNSATILLVHPGSVGGTSVDEIADRPYVLLDSTVFHPQGGGQPTDSGMLEVVSDKAAGSTVRCWRVSDVRLQNDGTVRHYLEQPTTDDVGSIDGGALDASLVGKSCRLVVDKEVRMLHAALHTSGHLLANVVEEVAGLSLKGFKGYHFAAGPNVEFNMVDATQAKAAIQDKPGFLAQVNAVIAKELKQEEEQQQHEILSTVEERPEEDEPLRRIYRTVKVGRFDTEACGGTHLTTLTNLSTLVATKLKVKKGVVKVSYECTMASVSA